MKKLWLLSILLLSLLPVRAEDVLQNSDFANGLDHWRGNGRSPADMGQSDPFGKPDPLLATGIIIPLRGHDWTTVTQNFRTKVPDLLLTIKLIIAPGVTFSQKDEDYQNIPPKIYNRLYAPFNVPKSGWFALFTDFGNGAKGVYYTFDSKPGSTDLIEYHADVSGLSPLESQVMTVAFPPGSGNIILRQISLDTK